jgi:hypothetical protein
MNIPASYQKRDKSRKISLNAEEIGHILFKMSA